MTDEDTQARQRALRARLQSDENPKLPLKTFAIQRVLGDLIALGVMLAMFGVCTTRFETVVVSGLVLIYSGVLSAVEALHRATAEDALARDGQFVHLLRLLNDPEARKADEGIQEAAGIFRKTKVSDNIHMAFRAVMSLIALWKLITAIWLTTPG